MTVGKTAHLPVSKRVRSVSVIVFVVTLIAISSGKLVFIEYTFTNILRSNRVVFRDFHPIETEHNLGTRNSVFFFHKGNSRVNTFFHSLGRWPVAMHARFPRVCVW